MNFKGCGMRQHVYRNLDQAELDREYNAAAHVGETRPYFDDYNARSAAARASLLFSPDIPYGSEEGETLDIFFQSRSCGAPIHVFSMAGAIARRTSTTSASWPGRWSSGARSLSSRTTACVPP